MNMYFLANMKANLKKENTKIINEIEVLDKSFCLVNA